MSEVRKLIVIAVTICGILWQFIPVAAASPGSLDTSFGEGGIALVTESRIRPREWVAGEVQAARSANGGTYVLTSRGTVLAFNPAGKLDRSFGRNGRLVVDTLEGLRFFPDGIAVDSAGRLLVAGSQELFHPTPHAAPSDPVAVLRFLPDGRPDTSFGGFGHVLRPVQALTRGAVAPASATEVAVAVDPRGRILVTAATYEGQCPAGADLLRFDESGEPDQSFGSEGIVMLDGGTQANLLSAPQWLGARGAFELAARGNEFCASAPGSHHRIYSLLRLGPDGAPDRGFGADGQAVLGSEWPTAIAVDPRGRTLVIEAERNRVRRVGPTGSYEEEYGSGGVARWPGSWTAGQIVVAEDGSALVAGTAAERDPADHSLLIDRRALLGRLTPDGRPDRDFGDDGVVEVSRGRTGEAIGTEVLLDGPRHALVAGSVDRPGNYAGIGLFRFDLGR